MAAGRLVCIPRKFTMVTPHRRVGGPRGPPESHGCIGTRSTPLATSLDETVHELSIVCLVCDGNEQLIFIKDIINSLLKRNVSPASCYSQRVLFALMSMKFATTKFRSAISHCSSCMCVRSDLTPVTKERGKVEQEKVPGRAGRGDCEAAAGCTASFSQTVESR